MTFRAVRSRHRHRVKTELHKMPLIRKERPEDTLDDLLKQSRIEELPSDDDGFEEVDSDDDSGDSNGIPFPGKHLRSAKRKLDRKLPAWLQTAALGFFHDDLVTTTSQAQDKVTTECLPHLLGKDTQGLELNSYGLPHLRRKQHAGFLNAQFQRLPPQFVAIDASRPWFFYWTVCGLSTLGEDVSHYRERLIGTVRPLQNPTGGFGGGHGQLSHCACSYATTLALATTGGLEAIDRETMWHWLGSIKQADGGFCMAVGAEEDIRGAYCAMTIITLLNLPLDLPPDAPIRKQGISSFLDRLGEWIGRCQTYEGGIGGAPTNEAHGAYAFCALACLSIMDAPHISVPKYLDVHALVRWLAARQTMPEGGFQGRQEKLVDACYSHWVGGCWALLQAALQRNGSENTNTDIWNREALVRYLLTCAQQPGKKGGMRDKPSTRPDAYHTCYSLAGLSHAENHYEYDQTATTRDNESGRLTAAFNWTAARPTQDEMGKLKVDDSDLVDFVHPVFVIPFSAVQRARKDFAAGVVQ